MPTKDHPVVATVSEFVEVVSEIGKKWMPPETDVLGPWFRGQANAQWQLVPKFYRKQDRSRNTEDEIREEFITRAPSLTDVHISNEWNWYFLMQHYGAPTRLLDWTDGCLIAMYFAVRDNRGYSDAAVWALDPWWLNKRVIKREEVITPDALGLLTHDIKLMNEWLPRRFRTTVKIPPEPVAIYPSHTLRRISTQRSCFTIHGTNIDGLSRLSGTKNSRLIKIIIPSYRVEAVRRDLGMCGIDEATVFPDLEGLARALSEKWHREEPNPAHIGAFTRIGRSGRHGVGVFAIRPIPKGTRLFDGDSTNMIWIDQRQVPKRPAAIQKLYQDFGVYKNGLVGVPCNFNSLTVSWYLNSSKKPNVVCDNNYDFVAARAIKAGEELTADYSTYSEEPGG